MEEWMQEDFRLIAKEEEMDEYDNQALTTHAKKRKNKKEEHSCKNKRTLEEVPLATQILSCDEKGHFTKE